MQKPILFAALVMVIASAQAATEKATFTVANGAKAKAAAAKVAGVSKSDVKGNSVSVEYDATKVSAQKVALALGNDTRLMLKVNFR